MPSIDFSKTFLKCHVCNTQTAHLYFLVRHRGNYALICVECHQTRLKKLVHRPKSGLETWCGLPLGPDVKTTYLLKATTCPECHL